ncbi:uncharacterized protein LOC129591672 [Paramacrobiotus metropolitanus]|uniref:uncharacterized protein LOC129591672 n=1 Tax=Paramacrobiotus metropolitanus TaxID=2943436 RepID=UPI002445E4C3|nr:uncharacterized protein LOC129591672 [Paramacrobiotus metropolitanus]
MMKRSLRPGTKKPAVPPESGLPHFTSGEDSDETWQEQASQDDAAQDPDEYPLAMPSKSSTEEAPSKTGLNSLYVRGASGAAGSLEVITQLLNTTPYDPIVQLQVPQRTMANTAFLILVPAEVSWKTLTDDGLGQWQATKGAISFFIKATVINGRFQPVCITQDQYGDDSSTYCFQRRLYSNTSYPRYRRLLMTSADQRCPLAFLQYSFQDGVEQDFEVIHKASARTGRWRFAEPVKRQKTDSEIIDSPALSTPVKRAAELNGHSFAVSLNEEPADMDAPPLFPALSTSIALPAGLEDVLSQCLQDATATDRFILDVMAAPSTRVFLSNHRQLHDVQRFCTNLHTYSLFCKDVIPNIGDSGFSLLFTLYEHLLVRGKDGRHPYVIGPMYLCQTAELPIFFEFAGLLLKHNFALQSLIALGPSTDSNMDKAFEMVFTHAKRYVQQSELEVLGIKKLTDMEINGEEKTNILQSITLLFANPDLDKEMESQVYRLMDEWQSMHQNGTDFGQFFLSTVVTQMRQNLELKKRSNGSSPDVYAQQACGFVKAHIKKNLPDKCSLAELVRKLREIIWKQEKDLEAAIIGKSELKLIPQYGSLFCNEKDLYSSGMPVSERRAVLNRIHTQNLL